LQIISIVIDGCVLPVSDDVMVTSLTNDILTLHVSRTSVTSYFASLFCMVAQSGHRNSEAETQNSETETHRIFLIQHFFV